MSMQDTPPSHTHPLTSNHAPTPKQALLFTDATRRGYFPSYVSGQLRLVVLKWFRCLHEEQGKPKLIHFKLISYLKSKNVLFILFSSRSFIYLFHTKQT